MANGRPWFTILVLLVVFGVPITLSLFVNAWTGIHGRAAGFVVTLVYFPLLVLAYVILRRLSAMRRRRDSAPSEPMLPPAGWYPDPSGAQAQRYWDGRQWTASMRPPQQYGT